MVNSEWWGASEVPPQPGGVVNREKQEIREVENHKDLEVWKQAIELAKGVYGLPSVRNLWTGVADEALSHLNPQ